MDALPAELKLALLKSAAENSPQSLYHLGASTRAFHTVYTQHADALHLHMLHCYTPDYFTPLVLYIMTTIVRCPDTHSDVPTRLAFLRSPAALPQPLTPELGTAVLRNCIRILWQVDHFLESYHRSFVEDKEAQEPPTSESTADDYGPANLFGILKLRIELRAEGKEFDEVVEEWEKEYKDRCRALGAGDLSDRGPWQALGHRRMIERQNRKHRILGFRAI